MFYELIDKFVDTINGLVCIRIVDGHSFLCHCIPIFQLYVLFLSHGIQLLTRSHLCQDAILTQKLSINV